MWFERLTGRTCLSCTGVQSCLSTLAFSSQCDCFSGWGCAARSRQWVGFPAGDSEQTHAGQDIPLHQHRAHGGGMSRRWADTSGRAGDVCVCVVDFLFHSCSQPLTTSNVYLWSCITLVSCPQVVSSLTKRLNFPCEEHRREACPIINEIMYYHM